MSDEELLRGAPMPDLAPIRARYSDPIQAECLKHSRGFNVARSAWILKARNLLSRAATALKASREDVAALVAELDRVRALPCPNQDCEEREMEHAARMLGCEGADGQQDLSLVAAIAEGTVDALDAVKDQRDRLVAENEELRNRLIDQAQMEGAAARCWDAALEAADREMDDVLKKGSTGCVDVWRKRLRDLRRLPHDQEDQLWHVVVGRSPWLVVKAETGEAALREARKRFPGQGRGHVFIHLGSAHTLVL